MRIIFYKFLITLINNASAWNKYALLRFTFIEIKTKLAEINNNVINKCKMC